MRWFRQLLAAKRADVEFVAEQWPALGRIDAGATVTALAEYLRRAGSTETERMIAALRDLPFQSPFGRCVFRAIDHQATLGAFVGRTALRNNRGTMVEWRYADGADYLPLDDEVRRLRPQGA